MFRIFNIVWCSLFLAWDVYWALASEDQRPLFILMALIMAFFLFMWIEVYD
jgi:hypothetical protein